MIRCFVALTLVFVCTVEGFTFPSDWQKIRRSMMQRRRSEREQGIFTRGSFGPTYDEYDEYDEDDKNSIQPEEEGTQAPVIIDPIMLEVMRISDFTEIERRFGMGDSIGVRGGFDVTTPAPKPFSGSDSVWNLTRALIKNQVYEGSTGNALFSPISILTTLNMLLLGTQGETNQEMRTALGYPRYQGLVHSQFQQIIKSMNEDIGVTVASSNALFTQVNFPLNPQYKEELKSYYDGQVDIVQLDFTRRPMTTMRLMNRFISSKTNHLIQNMFTEPVHQDSKIVVSNALYFNGTWEYEFEFNPPDFTGIDIKFKSFQKEIDLTLMSADMDLPFLSDPELGFEIASLPYEHDVRNEDISEAHMFLIRPNEAGEQNFMDIEQKLTEIVWEDIFMRMEPVYATIQLPRMKMEFQTNLAPTLADMGLKKLFSGKGSPDFSPLTPRWNEFSLDTLQHKTVLKITEKGTEAAAATSAFHFRMAPMKEFTLDRPFFLFIYDSLNKVVIFWSRVVEPSPLFTSLKSKK